MTKPGGRQILKDRISNLPNDVISRILSRMPTKQAVRTSIFSKHWKYEYNACYNIDIDDTHIDNIKDIHKLETTLSSFRSFMDRLLIADRDPRIQSFRAVLRGSKHFPNDLREWIPNILSGSVKDLAIEAYSIQSVVFPGSLSSCTSLTTIKLSLNGTLKFTVENCFPNLKSLYIQGKHGVIPIYNEKSSAEAETGKMLQFNFLVLEVLELRNCRFMNVDSVEISAPQLTRCTLDCAFSYRYRRHNNYTIKIVGPKLVEFNSNNGCLDKFVMCTPILRYAALKNRFFESEFLGCRANAFLNRVPSLEELSLSSEIVEVLAKILKEGHFLPIFDRLKQLELWWHPKELVDLIGAMPCLESLKLHMSYRYEYKIEELQPPFILPTLKEVELIDFRGENTQMELAKMLLKNGWRLERVIVSLGQKSLMSKENITRKLQQYVRVSSSSSLLAVQ